MNSGQPKRFPTGLLGTACLPWTEGWELDEPRFRAQLRRLSAAGVDHVYLFGTAGEGHSVSDRQRTRIVQVCLQEAAGRPVLPMIGFISPSQGALIERIASAHGQGFRDFQVALPGWIPLSDTEVLTFFHSVCGRFPDSRFMHYNSPRAGRLVDARLYRRIADEVPNLVAVKDPIQDIAQIHDLLDVPSPLQFFLAELGFGHAALLGECGLLISSGASNLARTRTLYTAALGGDVATVTALLGELRAMDCLLKRCAGNGFANGVYDKMRSKLADPDFPLRMLPPYQSPDDAAFLTYRDAVRRSFPQWLPDPTTLGLDDAAHQTTGAWQ